MKGILLLVLLSVAFCSKLRTQTSCATLLSPCDMFKFCCGEMTCKDFRCAIKGSKDILSWAPSGIKCDWFHRCVKGFKCRDNRCLPDL